MSEKGSLDFYELNERWCKDGKVEVYPDFIIYESEDLMTRGKDYYAAWDQEANQWNRNPLFVRKIVDSDIRNRVKFLEEEAKNSNSKYYGKTIVGRYLRNNSTKHWSEFQTYLHNMPDNFFKLDEKITFYSDVVTKKDHVSKRLPYDLKDGECPAWDELVSTLYDDEEREKIEWAIGAIFSGDAKKIQKFLVFYGPQGSGKSTIMNIVMRLFQDYYTTFKAENLVKGNDQFNLDFLSSDPLVAIDEDTNLSKIESNALLNTIVSHEPIKINEKFIRRYPSNPICMLMLGTNQPVKITDAKSGIIRRLIDIEPSGRKITPESHYDELNQNIEFELGQIAKRCIKVYKALGKTYYSSYMPERMMYRTDPFFNFMEESVLVYMQSDKSVETDDGVHGVTGVQLHKMWKAYCEESGLKNEWSRMKVVDEAKNYFHSFSKQARIDPNDPNKQRRNWFTDFKFEMFNGRAYDKKVKREKKPELKEKLQEKYEESKPVTTLKKAPWLLMDQTKSELDDILKDCPAQYEVVKPDGKVQPDIKWINCKKTLKDLNTSKVHYVQPPEKLICIDFDIKGADGKKDPNANIEAASKFPKTYAEFSKSGAGIHLHYWYDGDVTALSSFYAPDIEVKVFPDSQNKALRRKLSYCNNVPIAHISSGLPLKEKKVINWDGLKDAKHLQNILIKALKKEIRPYDEEPKTITCMKYIRDLLQSAQDKGMEYDLKSFDSDIYAFAAGSKNNAKECIDIYYGLKLRWPEEKEVGSVYQKYKDDAPIIILDCEVLPNVTLVVYKELGPEHKCIHMFNPKPHDIEKLLEMKIVGHNVIGYDNHILYALSLGWSPYKVYEVSRDIIKNGNRSPFREAKDISYTDTLDVASSKKSLKKIEIEMHFPHMEMEVDWDKPLPESEWDRLVKYCENDVLATEAYFLSKGWQADFKARQILAALTGMTVNDSTNNLTAQLIFGNVKEPWHEFVYPNLKEKFPEYRFENGRSYFEDVLIGEGGLVFADPGVHYNVLTLDIAGMHPTSEIVENGFGIYTKNYKDLYEARIAIKHKDYDKARKMFDGRLAPYLQSDEDADALSYALKIALNSVYGMTAAHFQNRFKDPRNIDNWVAKRGALFMETLRRKVIAMGAKVVHIKTDSIKLEKPTQEMIDFVINFGKEYGYTFEVESKYERMCLVNDAVYIALRQKDDPGWLKECRKAKEKAEKNGTEYIEPTRWTATGAQFAHPFIFKSLFSHEPLTFWDHCEEKNVKTSLYLDINENLPDVSEYEKEKKKQVTIIKKLQKILETGIDQDHQITGNDREKIISEINDRKKDIEVLDEMIAKGHHYLFIGRAGEFMPIKDGLGGGLLMRKDDYGGYSYATGAKGYRWLESEDMHKLKDWHDYIDFRYFRGLVDTAIDTINHFGDFALFARGEGNYIPWEERILDYNIDPWMLPCGSEKYAFCADCPDFTDEQTCKQGFDISKQILRRE